MFVRNIVNRYLDFIPTGPVKEMALLAIVKGQLGKFDLKNLPIVSERNKLFFGNDPDNMKNPFPHCKEKSSINSSGRRGKI